MADHRFVPSLMQLRVFLAVAERLHFRSAAEDLGMSQPSLSQALATLDVPAYPADALPPELAALPVEDPGSRRLAR